MKCSRKEADIPRFTQKATASAWGLLLLMPAPFLNEAKAQGEGLRLAEKVARESPAWGISLKKSERRGEREREERKERERERKRNGTVF